MKIFLRVILVFLITSCTSTQVIMEDLDTSEAHVASGPMIGYTEMREVQLWIQLDQPGSVKIAFAKKGNVHEINFSKVHMTSEENAFSAHITLSNLEPGSIYEYDIIVDGETVPFDYPLTFKTQELWQWRSDPPAFSFALGSCNYVIEEAYDRPGKPYGGDYYIFEKIADKNPDMMMWLGDNTYLREVDYTTRSGFIHRYSHTRQLPELQRLLATCPNYAIWDDHDYGPNDSDGSFIHKETSLEIFKMFWANNGYGLENESGIMSSFTFVDMDFFLLDNRYHRTHHKLKGDKETVLGNDQIDWLLQSLKNSNSPFKFICLGGAFLTQVDKFENYAQYKDEKAELLERISDNKIEGVFFLTGDRHMSEFCMDTLANGNAIFDLTVSPFTSKTYDNCDLENDNTVEGTCYPERNFATIDVSGAFNERVLSINLYSKMGELIWNKKISSEYQIID